MRRKAFLVVIPGRMVIALILALCLVLASSNSVVALSLGDYFSFSYSVEFSETQINGSETFTATVQATATCIEDLPLPYSLASKVEITGRIIAEHQETGVTVVLNTDETYTITITDFPKKADETTQVSQSISLQFPQGSQSGSYSVAAELVEARVEVAFIWWTVTDYLPSSRVGGSVTYSSSSGGGDPGSGQTYPPRPGQTYVSDYATSAGEFISTVVAKSDDGKVQLTIDKGVVGKTESGRHLWKITIIEVRAPLAPPADSTIVGLTYDLGPDGATFDPPVNLTFKYDSDELPAGVNEEDLVVAMWDEGAGEWVVLEGCTVNPVTQTITAPVSHFTAFTVLAYIRPAAFTTSTLSISPTEVEIGKSVTISVLITNTGDLAGDYKVNLKIDNVVVQTQEITLDGRDSETISFSMIPDTVGERTVNVSGLLGTFKVKAPEAPPAPPPASAVAPALASFAVSDLSVTPSEVKLAEQVKISAVVTNVGGSEGSYTVVLKIDGAEETRKEITLGAGKSETVTFTIAKDTEGSYAVNIDGRVGQFTVIVPPPPTVTPTDALPVQPPTDWWLIGGIIAGCVVVAAGLLVYFFVWRKRRAPRPS